MDKIYFEAQVYNMYSEDFEFLQNSLVAEVAKVYRQTIEPLSTSALIEGFSVSIDPGLITDTVNPSITYSTLNVIHPNGFGSFVTKDGTIVQTTESAKLLKLASYNPGVKNYICAKYSTVKGSYDRRNKVINENAAMALDLSDYTLVSDRLLDKGSIVIYSEDDYKKLLGKDLADLVTLAVVTSPGTNVLIPSVNVDTSVRIYVAPRITDKTITVEKLDPNSKIPQSYIAPTASTDINDHYDNINTPANLIDNLNQVRTLIRKITGSATWDSDPSGTLTNIDNQLTKLHIQGTVPSELNNSILTPTISQVDGSAAVVDLTPGKVLNEGKIYSQSTVLTLDLPAFVKNPFVVDPANVDWSQYDYANTLRPDAGLFLNSEEYDLAVIFEGTNIGGKDMAIHLAPQYVINPVGFAVRQIKTDGNIVTFDPGPTGDYVLNADAGTITFTNDTDIPSQAKIRLYYDYGFCRFDAVDIVDGAIQVTVGRAPARTNPIPPPVPAKGYRLCTILRHPFKQLIEFYAPDTKYHAGNIVYPCLTPLYPSRECIEVSPNATDVALKPYLQNKITYYTNSVFSTGVIKNPEIPGNAGSSWTINTNSELLPFARAITPGAFIITEFFAKPSDELWVRATRSAAAGSIQIDWEKTPRTNVSTSFTFDAADTANVGSVTINLATTSTDGVFEDVLIPVTRGLTEGFHKVKITALTASPVDVYGLIYGKLDTHYQRNNVQAKTILADKIVINGTASSNKDTGALVVQGGGGFESELFVNASKITGSMIQLNLQGSGDRSSTLEFHSSGADTIAEAHITRSAGADGSLSILNTGAGDITLAGAAGTAIRLGNGVNNPVLISSTAQTSALASGALVVSGGASVANNIFSGASICATTSFSFTGDASADSGLFWLSENRVQIRSAGVARLEMNNGLMIPMGSKTAAAGAYVWVE